MMVRMLMKPLLRAGVPLALCLLLGGEAIAQTHQLLVDPSISLGEWKRVERYVNTSLRNAPPPELAKRVLEEYGRPAIARCWLPLDDMWDYRTDKYTYNFQCGLDTYKDDKVKAQYDRHLVTETDVMFYDYLDEWGRNSDEVLLNIRRYEQEVTRGIISIHKWKEVVKNGLRHYKQRCPNLRYVQILNEYHGSNFGRLDDDQFYAFYRVGYELVNELNEELRPEVPLLVGGPTVAAAPMNRNDPAMPFDPRKKGQRLWRFLDNFAHDTNPDKRLDFVSFHEYQLGRTPEHFAEYEPLVDGWLREHGLSDRLPLFVTEIGVAGPKPDPAENLKQATGISTFFYHGRNGRDLRIFPWVLYHNPIQLSLVQFDKDLRMTPFGAAMKMWSMHKETEVRTEWRGAPPPRLFAIATRDEGGLAVQIWNYSDEPAKAQVELSWLPERLKGKARSRRYLVDSAHSNCLLQPDKPCGLEMVSEETGRPAKTWELELEPHGLGLWLVEEAE